jgi:hypothetical protein
VVVYTLNTGEWEWKELLLALEEGAKVNYGEDDDDNRGS